MDVKDVYDRLVESSEYKEWCKKNKEAYLAHFFRMLDKENEHQWQIGFYDKKSDRITTFIVEGSEIKVLPQSEVFKREGAEIEELDIKKVKLDSNAALRKSQEFQREKYKGNDPMKAFFILQNIEDIGTVYNITYVTAAFKTLNIKIDAGTGEIIKHKLHSLMDFNAKAG